MIFVKFRIKINQPSPLIKTICFIILFSLIISCNKKNSNSQFFDIALENGRLANEGYERCRKYVNAWLEYSDTITGLIPRNLTEDINIWNAKDAAADNYPFMVLTSAITDRAMFEGVMLDILKSETRLTSRIGRLPDTYSFTKQSFEYNQPDSDRIIFGSSEYIKDGLLPLTEWLGKSPWSDRMIVILDDIWSNAPVQTKFGNIPSTNVEVNGEMLQALSRVYWMTGNNKYLNQAIRLGDYYLLDKHHPVKDFDRLQLRDHGCEIISGLCELYATVHYALPEKKKQYEKPIHDMLDWILQEATNEHGMFYNNINPKTGEQIGEGIADTWGYTYNGFYTVYLIDHTETYRDAVLKVLNNLQYYKNYNWESKGSDGFADAIESALNLYNREPLNNVKEWIDNEIKIMWSIHDSSFRENAQKWKNSGIIEGWHGDGNFARTTIMYCLWKTQGIVIEPWRDDIIIGAVKDNNTLFISIRAEKEWEGKILFDIARHKDVMNLPVDWPRINQFPEWFIVKKDKYYKISNLSTGSTIKYRGSDPAGIFVKLSPDAINNLKVKEL